MFLDMLLSRRLHNNGSFSTRIMPIGAYFQWGKPLTMKLIHPQRSGWFRFRDSIKWIHSDGFGGLMDWLRYQVVVVVCLSMGTGKLRLRYLAVEFDQFATYVGLETWTQLLASGTSKAHTKHPKLVRRCTKFQSSAYIFPSSLTIVNLPSICDTYASPSHVLWALLCCFRLEWLSELRLLKGLKAQPIHGPISRRNSCFWALFWSCCSRGVNPWW